MELLKTDYNRIYCLITSELNEHRSNKVWYVTKVKANGIKKYV